MPTRRTLILTLCLATVVSVMFACPWYQEAAEMLKKYPNVTVGVHLVLNSEWRNYRWGPVLGRSGVPTLVDSVGYFLPSTRKFLASKYDLAEVERELDAQMQRAMGSGLKIAYVDYHMGTAMRIARAPTCGCCTSRSARPRWRSSTTGTTLRRTAALGSRWWRSTVRASWMLCCRPSWPSS